MIRLIYLAIIFGFFLSSAHAETLCRTSLSYKWKKAGPAVEEASVDKIVVEALGADEAQAKSVLMIRVPQEKAKVAEACRAEHENTSDCLSTKFAAKASVINALRFDARKALQDAIAADCAAQQGSCGAVVMTEPQCEERAVEAPTDGKEEKKGGAEKKK